MLDMRQFKRQDEVKLWQHTPTHTYTHTQSSFKCRKFLNVLVFQLLHVAHLSVN